MIMKYTISETTKTVTVETTEADGQVSLSDMEKAVKRFAKQYVDEPTPQALTFQPEAVVTAEIEAIDTPADPFDDVNFEDVTEFVLAREAQDELLANMVPANYLAAE
jgi:hypothetical protein